MLPDPLTSFWEAMGALSPRCRATRWGAVVTDPRFPLVWDANHAAVLRDVPALTAEEIRDALHPALGSAGATHEHVEFWHPAASPALREFRRGPRREPDLDMVFEGPLPARDPSRGTIAIREVAEPDDAFLAWYRDTRHEFGQTLSDEVVDQLMNRELLVFVPAGLRWFVASVEGRPAGFASLISLAGVGYIDGVVTMPDFRRRGVATAAVARAIHASHEAGDALVHLLAEEGGRPRLLYERIGFRSWGRVESFTRPLFRRP